MNVGETRTLAPVDLQSKVLAGQPAWTSSRPSDVQVTSWTMTSCTIKAVKSFSGFALIHCMYYYRELDPISGQYIYQRQGYVDYNVFVEASEPKSITISPTSISMDVGDIHTMQVTVLPSDADQSVTWTTSNFSIANVNSKNVLGASSPGTATVTATTSNGLKAYCVVNVNSPVKPESVTLQSTMTLTEGKAGTLIPTVSPANAVTNYTWSSSNTDVVTVSKTGLVTGINPGTAEVTVSTSNGKTALCLVTVEEKPPLPESISLPGTLTMIAGFSTKLIPVLSPDNAESTYKWTSSNVAVASVSSSSGKITAIKEGETVITVTSSNGLTAECVITVLSEDPSLPMNIIKDALSRIRKLQKYTM